MISLNFNEWIILTLLIMMMIGSVKMKKLTYSAAIVAVGIGFFVYMAAGGTGILMLVGFFLISVLATAHKKQQKAGFTFDASQPQGRNAGQVVANGGVAGLMSILALIDPNRVSLYVLMIACSLASALADTLSSELGVIYGQRFFNIITFKREQKGLDGVVSWEGTSIGAAGAGVIALIYGGVHVVSLLVLFAGVFGNLADSVMGALFERKQLLNNNLVNFLNTLFAAVIGAILYLLS